MEVNAEDALIPCSLAIISLFTEDYRIFLSDMLSGITFDYISSQTANLVRVDKLLDFLQFFPRVF